jgi:hypothetical protein
MTKIATLSMSLRLPPADAGCVKNSDDVGFPTASIRCAVCGIEVPLDEAVVPEATDQLTYLCGLDCYAHWRAIAAISFPSTPESD